MKDSQFPVTRVPLSLMLCWLLSVAIKAGPITRLCHVCGRQYGLSSFDIHLKQCKKLWVAQVLQSVMLMG